MNNDISVLFVHGHMGGRAQFDFLRPALDDKGICHRELCLPGHEGSVSDFARSGAEDWRRAYRQAVREQRETGRVIAFTHSMGGLLAIDHAAAHPGEAPELIIALCLPLRVRLTALGIKTRIMSVMKPRRNEDIRITAARDMCGVGGINFFNSARLVPNMFALLGMIRHTRKNIEKLSTPLVVINSKADDIVSPASVKLAERSGAVRESYLLEASSHFYFPENEQRIICDILLSSINNGGNRND